MGWDGDWRKNRDLADFEGVGACSEIEQRQTKPTIQYVRM